MEASGTLIPDVGGKMTQAFRLLRALLRHHKRLFFTAVGGAAVYATCTVLSSVVVQLITDKLIVPRFDDDRHQVGVGVVAAVLGILVAVGLVRAAGIVVRRTWAARTQWRVTESITAEVVDRLITQPAGWHRRQTPGDVITRAGVDAEAATAVLGPLPFASSVLVMIALSAVSLLVTDWILGMAALVIFPILIVLNLVYQRRVDRFFNTAQDELGSLSSAVHESFEGVAVVKSFGAERRETERLAVIAGRLRVARLGVVRLRSTFESLLDGVPNLANVALLIGGAYRVRSGNMTIGDLASFIYLFTLLVFPLRLIGFALSELPHSMAGWNRIRELLDQPVEPDPVEKLQHGTDNGVRLEDVVFSHDGVRAVLDGLTVDLPSGHTVAVVGATGSGKSTLLNLLAGLIGADSGTIVTPPGECLLVFQEPFLLAGSAGDNITMGAPITRAAIDSALAIAEANFVHDLPNGVDTEVGERGVGLSGGQRQRLALARALVRNPALLLLDDTTSALDPTTEAKLLGNLRSALTETTVVAVASRPSTISLADDVLFLADGVVVAYGAHEELFASVPRYRALLEAFEQDRTGPEAEFDEFDELSDHAGQGRP
ncbi:MAG: ABC transporter ATP-binding protein [Ilumatobacteraceae bacterium]